MTTGKSFDVLLTLDSEEKTKGCKPGNPHTQLFSLDSLRLNSQHNMTQLDHSTCFSSRPICSVTTQMYAGWFPLSPNGSIDLLPPYINPSLFYDSNYHEASITVQYDVK